MKYFIIILSLFVLISCKKTETKKVGLELSENDTIEVYNFEELSLFLEQEKDQIYVINFWATWCKPCIQELPYFEAAQKKYRRQHRLL